MKRLFAQLMYLILKFGAKKLHLTNQKFIKLLDLKKVKKNQIGLDGVPKKKKF